MLDAEDREFGIVLFDDEKDPSTGWISIEGGEPTRISGPSNLSNSVIWWSNLSFEDFFKKSEIWRIPWLRHDKYLVVSPKDCCQEWAINPKEAGSDVIAVICSASFSRVMRCAFKLLQQVKPKIKMSEAFTGKFLREDLRGLLRDMDYPEGAAATIMKSGSAYQEFTRTTVRGIRGARWLMLRRPRISYAIDMLQTPVPVLPFELMTKASIGQTPSQRIDRVLTSDKPVMAEVSIASMDSEVAPIFGFGNATDKDKRLSRSWVAHPELIVLSRFSDLDVRAMWIGEKYDILAPDLPAPVQNFLKSKYNEMSWSAGIVAETIWRAAALAEDKNKISKDREEKPHTSWQGAWIKSADKAATFLAAMELTEMGYSVVSYGLGWVRILVLEEHINSAIKDGLSLGLLPQLIDVPKGLYDLHSPSDWRGDKNAVFLAQMIAAADRDLLWKMDKLPLLASDEKRNQFLSKILEGGRKRPQ